MTTTDRIPTGFPRLDALLNGGLRAGTLTVVAFDYTDACYQASGALAGRVVCHAEHEPSPEVTLKTAWAPVDVAALKRYAHDFRNAALVLRKASEADALEPDADVLIRVTGKAYQLRVDVAKHRGGDTGSLVFTCVGGVLAEVGVCRWDEPRPTDPGVTAEGARWAEAMEDVVGDLTRRAASCQTLLDVGGMDARIEGKRAAYEHAAELLRAAIVDAKAGPR